MFLEPLFKRQRSGWIEVICGSMFSGKTEELIRRLKRARIANQNVVIVKHAVDTRFAKDDVVSHDANNIDAIPISQPSQVYSLVNADTDILGIDEAQFFDPSLVKVAEDLALKGVRVIIAGLDMDYKGQPFGCMPQLLAVAEYITKVHAICHHCGNLATHSYRLIREEEQVSVGAKEQYEARCRSCFNMGNIIDFKKSKKSIRPS